MKKLFRSIAAALIVATLTIAVVTVVPDSTAIQAEAISIKDVIKIAKAIKLKKNEISLETGEKFKLQLKNKPKDASAEFKIKSNSKYVTVSSGGTIKAKSFYGDKEVKAKICVTIKIKGKSYTIERPIKIKLKGKAKNKVDYSDAQTLEEAIKRGDQVNGKVVEFVVKTSNKKNISTPLGKFGYYMTSNRTTFLSGTSANKPAGSKAQVRIVKTFRLGSKYFVLYGNV